MVKSSHVVAAETFWRSVQEQKRIVQAIALSVSAMDETTIQTRELIAECRKMGRRLDRLFKRM